MLSLDGNRSYAVPKSTTGGSLQTNLTWNTYNAPLTATGPNSDTTSFSYDAYARPNQRTEANGAITTLTYTTSPDVMTQATTGARWTRTYSDGFGRTMRVVSGYTNGGTDTVVSTVDTKYAPCACSPIGKLWKTSMPYGPGGAVRWVEHEYDAIGRTVKVTQPEASLGAGSAGMTTYSYVANTVTVTDPAGKWKKSVSDVLGNLVSVIEPNPAGGADYVTDYTYSVFGKLLTASMTRPGYGGGSAVTQTRTWVYNANVQLTSVRHPESSTVANPSTRYAYNADGSILWTKDAKDQRVEFTYDTDGRVTERRRYYANGGEDTCGRVKYYYNTQSFAAGFTQNATGRLAATQTGCAGAGPGEVIEIYSYTAAGAVTKKRLRLVRPGGTVDKDVTYGYGTDGKLATVLYPGATIPYSYTYECAGRPAES